VNYNLISAYFASRQSAAALERAIQLIATAQKSPDLWLRLGRLLFTHLYYNEALNAFRLAREQAPADFESRFYLALTHFLLNQSTDAIRVLSSPPLPSDPESVNLLAASYARSGDLDKAVKLLQDTIAQAPQSPHAYLNLALIRLEQGSVKEAERALESLRSLGPQRDTKVFYSLSHNSCADLAAEIRSGTGVHPLAERANFYFDLASQLQDRYHYYSAVEILRLARPYEGESARLMQSAGLNCLNLAPQGLEAIWMLRKAVVIDPAQHEAWNLLGRAYLRQGDFEGALTALRRAMALKPRAAYAVSLGKALLFSKPPDAEDGRREAMTAFEQAVTLEPSNAVAHFELGRLLSQSDSLDAARDHLMRAVDLEPDFYEALYVLSRVCALAGDKEQSQKYLALFERTKSAVVRQSVVGSGYISEGREP
jgi:Flp pilus assembly protein TadD